MNLVYLIVGIGVGLLTLMTALLKAIYSAAKHQQTMVVFGQTIKELKEAVEKLNDRMDKQERREYKRAVRNQGRRGRLSSD